MIGIGLNIGNRVMGGFDSSASAFFAATGITGTTEQQAVNTLVTSLKSAGLWSKMKAVYPFVTDNRNLLSYTEDFGNAYWGKGNSSITTDSTTAPNGTSTADKLTINAATDEHLAYNTIVASTTAGQYTSSVYLKKGNTDYIQLANNGANGANYAYIVININNGAVTQSGASGTYTLNSYDVTSVGNGWYRCSMTHTTTGDEARGLRVRFSNSATPTIAPYGSIIIPGNGTDFFYLWGGQFQTGALTTYQPIATTQQSYISNQFKYNLVNPVDSDAAFRGVFNGGWTFSNQGALPNGTNGYMDTKLVPSSALQLNSVSHSVYSRSLSPIGIMGGVNDAVSYFILNNATSTTITSQLNSIGADFITGTVTNSQGLLMANRTDSTTVNAWRNSTKVATDSKMSTFRPTIAYYIGSRNNGGSASGYDAKQYGFYHIGDGLTDTEATALYNAVNQFQISLSRNV